MTDLISRVITELRQVPGVSTQTYSSNVIAQAIETTFFYLIDEEYWPELRAYQTVTPDGTTGRLSADLVGDLTFSPEQFDDIEAVFLTGTQQRIPQLPVDINPLTLSGATPRYISADLTLPYRPFRIWPIDATDGVDVVFRQRPPRPFGSNTLVYLDALALIYGAAWMYSIDDAMVPAQVTKFESMYRARKAKLRAGINNQPIPLRKTSYPTINDWQFA